MRILIPNTVAITITVATCTLVVRPLEPMAAVTPPPLSISQEAASAMNDVRNARFFLQNQKVGPAKDELVRAGDFLQATDTRGAVPIYVDLDFAEGYVPSDSEKQTLALAKADLMRGNQKSAFDKLQKMKASVIYTIVKLPVGSVNRRVKAAIKALDQKSFQNAGRYIDEIENSLQITIAQLNASLQ